MKYRAALTVLAIVATSLTAGARMKFYSGILGDGHNKPLEGRHTFALTIYSDSTGTTPVWNLTRQVKLKKGKFKLSLSSAPDSLVAGKKVFWLGTSIDGGKEMRPLSPYDPTKKATMCHF